MVESTILHIQTVSTSSSLEPKSAQQNSYLPRNIVNKNLFFRTLIAASAITIAPAFADTGDWSQWNYHLTKNFVNLSYRMRQNEDHVDLQWKCTNRNGESKKCIVGAGKDKKAYTCFSATGPLGNETTGAEESAIVQGKSEALLSVDEICRGRGASFARPYITNFEVSDN